MQPFLKVTSLDVSLSCSFWFEFNFAVNIGFLNFTENTFGQLFVHQSEGVYLLTQSFRTSRLKEKIAENNCLRNKYKSKRFGYLISSVEIVY